MKTLNKITKFANLKTSKFEKCWIFDCLSQSVVLIFLEHCQISFERHTAWLNNLFGAHFLFCVTKCQEICPKNHENDKNDIFDHLGSIRKIL